MKFETRIKTEFGEIVVNFDSVEELKQNTELLDLGTVSEVVSKKFGSILKKEPRTSKPGLENLYRFTPEGKVELLQTPTSVPLMIGLLLYANDPYPMSSEEMAGRGITASDYIYQTAYKKYFGKAPGDSIVLTQLGRRWVETEVIPKTRGKTGKDHLLK